MQQNDSAYENTAREFDFLKAHTVVETGDVDELAETLTRIYDARSVACIGDATDFYGKAAIFQFATCSLSYCCYRGTVEADFADDNEQRFHFAIAGSAKASSYRNVVDIDPSVIVSTLGETTFTFGSAFKQMVLRADRLQLERDVGLLLGANPKGSISFAPTTRLTSGHAALFRRTALQSAGIVDGTAGSIPPPLLNEIEQTIRMAALFGVPHNFSEMITATPASSSSGRVKRIEEWIDANWRESITLERLVEISGVSGRSIFMAFKKMRGYSPMAYVKARRLKAAKEMLSTGAPDVTVTGIGYFCHFTNMSRFADDYRCQFGELPSRTLQRAKIRA